MHIIGGLVGDFSSTISEVMTQPSALEALIAAACTLLLIAFASLAYEYYRLKIRYDKAEADLLDRTVGTHSRNWTNTARSLETKAKEPGEVARSSAMTYLHMLDEAADAWLKGSQWQDALRVTQQFLVECAHAIGKPGMSETELRAIADLMELRLSAYPDLSKAANEAPDNALKFLAELDSDLTIIDQSVRVAQLRDQISNTRAAIEIKANDKGKAR